jgi:uncharacterized protein
MEAIEDNGLQQLPETALFERLDAQARRTQMQSLNMNSDRVPVPNFNCAKAKSNTERTICGSYRLSLVDSEYGDLYRRASPLDKKGEVKREAHQSWLRRESCNGALSCIEDNLNHGVNYLAKFLRRNGVSAITAELVPEAPAVPAPKSRAAERAPNDEATEYANQTPTQITSLSDFTKRIKHRWVKYGEDGNQTSYIDLASIIRVDGTLTVLNLQDWTPPPRSVRDDR